KVGTGFLNASLEAKPITDGGASVTLEVREVLLPGSLTTIGPGRGNAEGKIRDGGLDLLRAEIAWRGLAVSIEGRVAAGPALSVRAKADAALGILGRVVGETPVGGRAGISVALHRRGAVPAIEGRAEINDLIVSGQTVAPIDASFRLAAAPGPGPDSRWVGT